ncbi:hypothetical protein ACJX0J_042471, partial [Zea mays]
MDPFNNNDVRPPLRVLSSNTLEDDCPDVAIGDGSIIDCTIPCGITLGYNWLGGCDDARQRKRERERARYAMMSDEKKNELKRRRQSSKNENVVHHERSKGASAQTGHQHDSNPSSEVLDARERKRIREQIRFATLTREQRALRNTTPCQKSARENYSRRQQAMLAQDSIAIENPKFTPELVWSSADSQPPTVSLSSSKDMVISELSATPFVYASLQTKDVDMDKMTQSPRRQRHEHHVSSGERQSLISRQNQKFQSTIRRNVGTVTRDHGMEGESTSPCPVTAPHSDIMTEGADVGMQRQITLNVTTNDADEGVLFVENHDEDVLFEDDDEEDGYLFAGQDGESIEDIEIDETQDAFTVNPDVPDLYDKVYSNIPEETHLLSTVADCGYCKAKKFQYEPPGFCCRNGQIDLAPFETPPQLRRLWECSDADARHFRDNIRFFNGHFSFTSLYCCLDSMTTNMDCGIYTFRAHGMMYHNVRSFGREVGAEHKHLELYFYDDDPSLEHRYRKCRQEQFEKDKAVIKQLVEILKGNPYSEHLRSMGNVDNIEDYHIALNLDQTLNQKLYNVPITSEVAAVWIEGSERRGQFNNSVMLHGKDRSSHGIRSYHGCYDALSYPLFFPKGELGWHANIPKSNVSMDEVDAYRDQHRRSDANNDDTERPSHLCVSVRDYYCYRFQIRPSIFNPILHGKRLFQQFAVDTYIKIESSRLDFIRKNQDRLRADLYKGLVDSLHEGENRADKIGKRTVLSTSFIGGPRDMRHRYMDAMALVRKFGKPDIFLTMTRRDDGRKETVRGCELDNRWVVPYNPYLLRLFNCHINVEACGSIKAVKYLFKYIYKGHDRASVAVTDANKADGDVDEIKQYRDARWVTPPEALWRIFSFDLSQNSPPVMQLQLHLENMHMVSFHERAKVNHVVQRKVWQRRKRNTGGQVGRIVSAHPAEGERFYLRLLLNHVTGATSYADLRTVDGDTLPSFREAAQRRGLLEADDTIDECLNEAAIYQMSSALRRLFATILVYCEPNDVAELWQRHLDSMSEDYHRSTQSKTHVQQMVLIDIRNILQSMGKDIKTFPLPAIIDKYDDSHGTDREIYEEESIEPTAEDVAMKETLNEEQRFAYDKILSVVDTNNGGVFFVDGPGGTGNIYLYKALLAALRSQDKIAVATATSGVAASILPGGRTAHSRFKIPLTIDDGAVCSFTKQSGTTKLLQKASLIILDEASMTKRQAIEALDNSMRDIMGRPGLPFGGRTVVFGGDFRQVLPVVRKGSRAQIVAASLRSSYLWESMCHLKLVQNMRAQSDPWFAEYLLRVGGGTEEANNDGDVRLPDEVCVPYTGNDRDLDRLIDDIYPNLNANMSNTSYITSRAILSTRNDWVDMINMRMIDRFQGEQM